MRSRPRHWLWLSILLLHIAVAAPAHAQYFGRNKVQYKSFDFKVLKTDHFDVYYYESERAAVEQAARMAERWYARLSRVLDHELSGRQPLILYGSHPDFEQTNAIAGELGEGTGGVTEILKRRIVLPLGATLAETDHVIGHELVHAFQFDITRRKGGGLGFQAPTAVYLPLWFIEGMAEYLSLGPNDPHTAMWLRDAAHRNKLPNLSRLSDPRFFPYRYGEAFWSYVAGRWGDDAVGRILKGADRNGDVRPAFSKAVGMGADTLVLEWHQAIRDWNAEAEARTDSVRTFARQVIATSNSRGRMNISPSLSPDGKRVMFFSERDLFSIELFLADVETGRVIRRLTRSAVDPHLQSLQFIASAGAWSPDGARFAFAAVADGVPELRVVEVESGRTSRVIRLEKLGEVFTPTWSPDGKRIALSTMSNGVTDLVMVDLESGSSRRLTDDLYADLAPAWSPDGRRIAFVTDRFHSSLEDLRFGHEQIALMDPETGRIEELTGASEGKNINPQWSSDGRFLYFVSDRNGISNLYRLPAGGGEAEALTNLLTGISGITRLSPAISTARSTDRLVFSAYESGGYSLYAIDSPSTASAVSRGAQIDPVTVATLPPVKRENAELPELLSNTTLGLGEPAKFNRARYRAGLGLDFVSSTGVGLAAGSSGLAVGGGTALSFSDMLGNHNLVTALQMNNGGGSFNNNFAGIAQYRNLKSRLNWGAEAAQIPYVSREFLSGEGTFRGQAVFIEQDVRFWQIEREFQGSLAYPFSRVQRIELAAGYRNISFENEVESFIYSQSTGELLAQNTQDLPSEPGLNLVSTGAALVYDSAIFGGTSPVIGQSYRIEVAPVFGDLQYVTALGDYRRYVPIGRPLTLAGRLIHYGRYGRDGEDGRLSELFLGSPWLMHGYDDASFTLDECSGDPSDPRACPEFDQLLGTRLAVGNLELRLPLFGALGIVPSPGVPPLEFAGFYDAGVAWRTNDEAEFLGGNRKLVTSYGGLLRFNLFGLAVAEVALVHPDDRPIKGWYWQFNLQPGF
jgi:Tol biopolymer transport system component